MPAEPDRSWNAPCAERSCRHPPEEHLATPELAGRTGEPVVFCQRCRRHEVQRPLRIPWIRFTRARAG